MTNYLNSAPQRPQVALLIETSNAYSRGLLGGIRTYMREGANWEIHFTEQGRGDEPPPWFHNWHGHGVIARIENGQIEEAVAATKLPVVNVSGNSVKRSFPTVASDSDAVCAVAAEHLLERGFRLFGYCGDVRFDWSLRHEQNFRKHLRDAGFELRVFDSESSDAEDWLRERSKLANWLLSLPKPIGIFACYDIRGQQLLDVCRQTGLSVPDEVAVIGHHNDELLCELCDPPLSSIIPNARRAGYEAAELLDRMMQGRPIRNQTRLVAPIGVFARKSTEAIAVGDIQIAQAMRFIRDHACEGIGVEDVLKVVPISRTVLERRFQKFLRRSPYEEILRLRLERVKQLLTTTDLSIAHIADLVGFSGVEYLSAMFKRKLGISPREFRRSVVAK
ncbi:MAG TPA: DNA-binding transcriptional regulator [Chthoniobacterales bacterium]|nr:DNA-binding transcriptional regulator [Chthoniobacterales bacterium]